MGIFSDILLCVDYDRTLTAPDSTIPEKNLEAIRYFMDNGGAFTVNTGRSLPMAKLFMDKVPVNAPLLLYNGGAAFDMNSGSFPIQHPIPIPRNQLIHELLELAGDLIVEMQGITHHFAFIPDEGWANLYRSIGCDWRFASLEEDLGPFLKVSALCPLSGADVAALFNGSDERIAQCDRFEESIHKIYGSTLTPLRAAPTILDIQAGGINKGTAALELKDFLRRKTLVCIGDERNDLDMLNMADFSFCPADGKIAPMYTNVAPCADGAVADVIYRKIPEILG